MFYLQGQAHGILQADPEMLALQWPGLHETSLSDELLGLCAERRFILRLSFLKHVQEKNYYPLPSGPIT